MNMLSVISFIIIHGLVSRHLTVLYGLCTGDISFKSVFMFSKCPRVDHLTAAVLRSERFKLVRRYDEVREGIETKGPVVVPVHRAHVQGQGGQVGLAGDRLSKVRAHVPGLGVVDGVPAHLGHDVLPEDYDLLGAELNPGWVGEELTAEMIK